MTDLEKLKAVFDDIGVEYEETQVGSETYLTLESTTYHHPDLNLNFNNGKFEYID